MKVVVADTSPINYLVLIDCVDILRRLYARIVIPQEVLDELTASGTPPQVAAWIQKQPEWLDVRPTLLDGPPRSDAAGEELGSGPALRKGLPDSPNPFSKFDFGGFASLAYVNHSQATEHPKVEAFNRKTIDALATSRIE